MLNHHSKLAIPLESLFITDYLRARPSTPPETFRRLILNEYELKEWGMPYTPADFDGCVTAKDFIDRAHELYLRQHHKEVWGQKTPRFVRFGDLLKKNYPQAKFVVVLRDPRAAVSSLIRSNVHHSNALFAARRWQRDMGDGVKLKQDYPGDVCLLRYEDLICTPEESLRQVCTFLEIEFEPEMLEYHKTGTTEYSGYYAQIHEKLNEAPDKSRIDAWRKHMTPPQIAVVESICGDLMESLGYPRESAQPVDPAYVRRLKRERVLGLIQQIWHNYATRKGYLTSFLRRRWALGLMRDTLKNVNY
jgi:hypothetical protein